VTEQQARREGFHDPIYCPRGRDDCKSLAQIISTGHVSFVCCGENDGQQVSVATDRYRFCHRTGEGVDVLMNHDQRDMAHIAAVFGWALAAVISPESGHAPGVGVVDQQTFPCADADGAGS
jgi:hypothetical protein